MTGNSPSRLPVVDEFGNPMWWASSEGDGLCPTCGHAPDLHGSTEGCFYAFPDDYTYEPGSETCGCPLQTVAGTPSAMSEETP